MIDVTKPLEAIEINTGRIVPLTFKRLYKIGGDKEAIETTESPDEQTSNETWHLDGTDWCAQRKWKLRNVLVLPADWAIEHALAKSAKCTRADVWSVAGAKSEYAERVSWAVTVIELARMIDKYEPHLAPVDPDVLAVREILGAYNEAEGRSRDAEDYRNGTYDNDSTSTAALAAYRKVKSS